MCSVSPGFLLGIWTNAKIFISLITFSIHHLQHPFLSNFKCWMRVDDCVMGKNISAPHCLNAEKSGGEFHTSQKSLCNKSCTTWVAVHCLKTRVSKQLNLFHLSCRSKPLLPSTSWLKRERGKHGSSLFIILFKNVIHTANHVIREIRTINHILHVLNNKSFLCRNTK